MWRQAVKLATRRHPPTMVVRPGGLSIFSSCGSLPSETTTPPSTTNNNVRVRSFSRRASGMGFDDPEEELFKSKTEGGRMRNKTPSATEMEFFSQLSDDFDDLDDEDEKERQDSEAQRKQAEVRQELSSRTGRGWSDPWEISEEQWMSTALGDDLPDWAPQFVSRISQERVKVYPEGIPTLSALAALPIPPEACPHPGLGKAKEYAAFRKHFHYVHLAKKAQELAKPQVAKITMLKTWEEKQDAVDELFESVEEQLRKQEEILGLHPNFGNWVVQALEEYLTQVQEGENKNLTNKQMDADSEDAEAQPMFMDCFDFDEPDLMVPSILSPLQPHARDGPGRMVEEWELSAHKETKRILIRACTRKIAQTLENNEASRIFVHGRKGVGKTAVLASVVASARKSGHVVLYLPDGDRLRKNGFFIIPSPSRAGMYELQDLSMEACASFLESHEKDLSGMEADRPTMEKFLKESMLNKIPDYSGGSMGLVELLKHAAVVKAHAPACFSIVVDTLMNQTEKSFFIVLDEFNCYFDKGHYFHRSYDDDVRESIPYNKINLFEHALGAMALSTDVEDEGVDPPTLMKRGGIIVGVTESHAVRRLVTDGLTAYAESRASSDESLHVVEVPRFSSLEVDHVLANFEAIGVGKLRLDRGDTVMNAQEVEFLKMVSCSIGQRLLEVSLS